MSKGYITIAGEWSYASLRVGLVVRSPDGKEIYCQPGDDEQAMRANIEAIEEYDMRGPGSLAEHVADVIFAEYF